ncbi:hypothetical protein THARTR1_05591 [Trichoderma harzianum]|uniref:Uncharacterized protein n=1 Tax=Trichoderma harzianum TaxID=5544 RepID=A0A2K0U9D2_TRIHA|nr:hypothetical protein THARTR1_05591 [Trichoderma harzianum]
MPTNMPTAANQNGENFHLTDLSFEQNAIQNCHSYGNNQELVNSGQVSISQGPNTRARKRHRVKDEEEDELASPMKYTRMSTSATPRVANWEACTLCQLFKSDPESLYDLLDGNRAEIQRQRIKIKSLEAELKQERESHEAELKQEKKSHEENRRIRDNRIKTLTFEMEQLIVQSMEDFGTKKVSDNAIKSMWGRLSYKIKNTVSNYFTEWPQEETISINGIEYHRPAESTSADRILAVRDSLKRRQLWGHLYCNIFAAVSRYHLGNIGGSMARLTAQLDVNKLPSPEYLQMISKIKSALDPDLEQWSDPQSHTKRVEMIQNTIVHFKEIIADKKLHEFEDDLKTIFSDAWDIYTAMMTSKAIFIMQWPQNDNGEVNDYPYDPETMELSDIVDPSDAPEHTVGVIESPVLWKIGNGDGENFDSARVLCKHCVFQWEDGNESSTSTWDESSS